MKLPLLLREQIASHKFDSHKFASHKFADNSRDILNHDIYIIMTTINYLQDKSDKRLLYWLNYRLTRKIEKLCILYEKELLYLTNMRQNILDIKPQDLRLHINVNPMMFTLPNGWGMKNHENRNLIYFIDHNTKTTQWLPPKELIDKYIKEISIKHKI